MIIVLDASMALAWLFTRHSKKEADCADRLLMAMEDSKTIVPPLWHTEIANALLVGERRRIITEAQVVDYLTKLSELPIITDDATLPSRREPIMALAREHHLTAYDSTYLDLALRNNAVIASFDAKLIKAMSRAGGKVFGE